MSDSPGELLFWSLLGDRSQEGPGRHFFVILGHFGIPSGGQWAPKVTMGGYWKQVWISRIVRRFSGGEPES